MFWSANSRTLTTKIPLVRWPRAVGVKKFGGTVIDFSHYNFLTTLHGVAGLLMGIGSALFFLFETADLLLFIAKGINGIDFAKKPGELVVAATYAFAAGCFGLSFFTGNAAEVSDLLTSMLHDVAPSDIIVLKVTSSQLFALLTIVQMLRLVPEDPKQNRFYQWLRLPVLGWLAFMGFTSFKFITPIYWNWLISAISNFISSVF